MSIWLGEICDKIMIINLVVGMISIGIEVILFILSWAGYELTREKESMRGLVCN